MLDDNVIKYTPYRGSGADRAGESCMPLKKQLMSHHVWKMDWEAQG